MSVTALVGAQYGSEGKGAIAKVIAKDFDVHVRTGGPNAGHTIYHEGRKWVMRSVPCGWVNPSAHLVIGAGALIDLELLVEEVKQLDAAGYDVSSRLYVDRGAGVIDASRHKDFEGGTHGHAHETIGSTGEGVGPARMARIARGTFVKQGVAPAWSKLDFASDYAEELISDKITPSDTVRTLNAWMDLGANILLEGTQGSGLSLIHGSWPYVTSHDTNVCQLLTDAGLAPRDFVRTILVARTFPIRVAGNSGPLEGETTFEEIGVEPEYTTVTKKIRRVGKWDDALIEKAFMLNRPATLALTFADYWWPEVEGATTLEQIKQMAAHPEEVTRRLQEIANRHSTMIQFIGTGPDSVVKVAMR